MPALYGTEPGSTVRLLSRSLRVTVRVEGRSTPEVRGEVELHRLEVVALVGAVHLTYDALAACQDEGITVSWLDAGGRLRGRMVPQAPRSADLRKRQYEAMRDEADRLARARRVVQAKLVNAGGVLRGLRSNHARPELAAALAAVRELGDRVGGCADAAVLLGLEGAAARAYFAGLATVFVGEVGFHGRQRRPPPDPANALLSLGYTLLTNRLAGLVEARGLDPAWGFFREDRPGRPSLALDLVEELRHPLVDRFVVRNCNLRVFQAKHFEPDAERPGGVRLTREGWRLFLSRWEEHQRQPLREAGGEAVGVEALLLRQLDRLAADLRGGPAYEPYRMED